MHRLGRKGIESFVIGRMTATNWPWRWVESSVISTPLLAGRFLDLIAIGFRFGRLFEIEEPSIPGWNLYSPIPERCRPFTDRCQTIERGLHRRAN